LICPVSIAYFLDISFNAVFNVDYDDMPPNEIPENLNYLSLTNSGIPKEPRLAQAGQLQRKSRSNSILGTAQTPGGFSFHFRFSVIEFG
jgi:hypothetical protein